MVRFKNRYFLLSIAIENDEIIDGLSPYALQECIKEAIDLLFGEYGTVVGQAVSVKYFSPYTGCAIVRTSRDYHKLVWAAITFITTLRKRRCSIQVIHASGTIKLLQKFAIDYDQKQIIKKREQNLISQKKAKSLQEESLVTIQKLQ
jgi:ribonuclease P/MRP protein subunit POP5